MNREEIINKWNRAIINIEARPKQELLVESAASTTNKIEGYTGTAIFLKNNDNHYLITARHVVEDKDAAIKEDLEDRICWQIMLIQHGTILYEDVKSQKTLLVNFQAGATNLSPYIFSSEEDDLAIISLNERGVDFIQTLLQRGYEPIALNDIDTVCDLKKGEEIISFTFPSDFFQIDEIDMHIAELNWKSNIISLPVVSDGTVSDCQQNENYFSGNIYVMEGSSGGAIVSNNKLVGIVSRKEPVLIKMNAPPLNYYLVRKICFTKSSLVIQLVRQLEKKFEDLQKLINRFMTANKS